MNPFPSKIFITATDTGIGKTFISAILTLGLKGKYWKPIQSGLPSDTAWIKKHTKLPLKHFYKEKYLLKKALSPHISAAYQNTYIDLNEILLPQTSSPLIVEGCGGVLVPINNKHLIIDLIKRLNIPTIIVARTTMGTINHTLLTIKILKSYNIPIFGIILNGKKNKANKKAIENYGNIKVIAQIEPIKSYEPKTFKTLFIQAFAN